MTGELHDAVEALRDDDGETYSFVRYLHERFGVVIATSDSHAGEYYREAVEHAPPKDFLTRQVKLRRMVDDVADAIVDGRMDLEPFLQWEASEPLRPILRAAITGEPERIASAILPNDDLVPALPADCAVEVSAVASGSGIAGDRTDDLPLAFTATLRHEVAIQQLLADAALLGSRDAALQALLIDPVVGSSGAAERDPRRLRGRARRPLAGAHLTVRVPAFRVPRRRSPRTSARTRRTRRGRRACRTCGRSRGSESA